MAGLALGFERSASGHSAGARTTLRVALAACLARLQANWLMTTAGKTPDSFVTLDVMRLPLGVLTGVGFIGGGAILKRGDSVFGLTTAATRWFVTVIGLCFGGGRSAELELHGFDLKHNGAERVEELSCRVVRKKAPTDPSVPAGLIELNQRPGVLGWEWKE